jgi:tetratricopeptide (TPR) repeat protein
MVKYKEPKHENLYLGVMNNVLTGNKKFALENIDLKLESGNDQLKENYYALKIGYIDMYDADLLYQRGELFYEKKEYKVAADLFLQASNLNPFEFPYKENAANAYMQMGKDSLSLKLLDELINKDGSKSPKTYYLRGLVLYGLDKKTLACQDLRVADNAGLFVKTNLYNILCSQP